MFVLITLSLKGSLASASSYSLHLIGQKNAHIHTQTQKGADDAQEGKNKPSVQQNPNTSQISFLPANIQSPPKKASVPLINYGIEISQLVQKYIFPQHSNI